MKNVTRDKVKGSNVTNIIQRLESNHQLLTCKFSSRHCNTCFCMHDVIHCFSVTQIYFNDMTELNLSQKLQ